MLAVAIDARPQRRKAAVEHHPEFVGGELAVNQSCTHRPYVPSETPPTKSLWPFM